MSLYLPWRAPILYLPMGAIVILALVSLHASGRGRLLSASLIASGVSLAGFFYLATERLSVLSDAPAAALLSYLPFSFACGAGPVALAAVSIAATRRRFGPGRAALVGAVLGCCAAPALLDFWSNVLAV